MKKVGCLMGLPLFFLLFCFFCLGGAFLQFTNQKTSCEASEGSIVAIDKDMTENAKQISVAIKRAFPKATWQGIAGMLGNLQQESGLRAKAVQNSDPLSGHGIAQWTAGRCTALKNYAQQKGKAWDDLGLQIEFLITELKGSEQAGVRALEETAVEKATEAWQLKFERAGNPVMANRLSYANHWYSVIGTSDPISSSTLGNSSGSDLSIACSSVVADYSDVLTIAKTWLGWFHYDQIHPAEDLGRDLKNPKKEGHTDCSGFVWLVLNKAGYQVPANMQWYTGFMANDARGAHHYFQAISESETQAGDVIIVNQGAGAGSNGHTGILVEKWTGQDTKVIQEGGNGDSVNVEAFRTSFTRLISGGDICFARPVKKGQN